MAKKGYVSRSEIERAIESHLVATGATNANTKARAYISSYKNEVPDRIRSKVILNEGDRAREQYRCQDLGEWLYNRKGALKEFRSTLCPIKIKFDVSVVERIEIDAGALDLSAEEMKNPRLLSQKLIEQKIAFDKLLAKQAEQISEYEKKEAKTKELKRLAGKEGGRGRPKY
ncbi:hypothetical protein [Polynucleobacter sp. JS-Fieb-80-E5]|uniref:hypothetical protein n=1 Tax=Polynucleobacter sp. JS-Fieb-80-E5 TaxID=2081050 RepID=UPI001C0E2E9D|nr:hypothetical protein [Polynucleobacter sp. JS-Fieb-80-E5]MBU3617616.1 hypothetical protein [Polynucleobacter sp. JS-Fieb-80-E5]